MLLMLSGKGSIDSIVGSDTDKFCFQFSRLLEFGGVTGRAEMFLVWSVGAVSYPMNQLTTGVTICIASSSSASSACVVKDLQNIII